MLAISNLLLPLYHIQIKMLGNIRTSCGNWYLHMPLPNNTLHIFNLRFKYIVHSTLLHGWFILTTIYTSTLNYVDKFLYIIWFDCSNMPNFVSTTSACQYYVHIREEYSFISTLCKGVIHFYSNLDTMPNIVTYVSYHLL